MITLDKVLYVLAMIKNLICISCLLDSTKYNIKFDGTGCCLLDSPNNFHIAKAELQDRLYGLDLRPPKAVPSAHVTVRATVGDSDSSMLRHAWVGHINE